MGWRVSFLGDRWWWGDDLGDGVASISQQTTEDQHQDKDQPEMSRFCRSKTLAYNE